MAYNTDEILISASVLSAYWEHSRNDVLDLLVPFLKYAIASTTKQDEKLSVKSITDLFKKEFGFYDIPQGVVITILNRLSPKILKRDNGDYYLKHSLVSEYEDYNKNYLLKKEHQENVCKALAEHLNKSIPGKTFDEQMSLNVLFSFFQSKGLFIAKDTMKLNEIYSKESRVNYEIAKFVIEQFEKKSLLFECLVEMVKGYFISTAISYHNNSSSSKSKLTNLNCYLDTRIIINALGLHLPKDITDSAIEFISMLKKSGAKLYCFSHNVSEIRSIIYAYRASLINYNNFNGNTLETFDENKYTPSDVDNYLSILNKKIESLGISIIDVSSNNNSDTIDPQFCYADLQNELKSKMNYYYRSVEKASDIDCKSVEAIFKLRNGQKTKELEKAHHIFVSNSFKLAKIVKSYFNSDKEHIIPFVISEIDISSWLWIRDYSTHPDFPKNQLLLNANMALEIPSSQFLDIFYEKIDVMKSAGKLSYEEAVTLRTDMFCRKEIYKESYGDSDEISEDNILNVKEKLKRNHIGNAEKSINDANSKLMIELKKNERIKMKAYDDIREAGVRKLNQILFLGKIIITVLFLIIALCIVALWIVDLDVFEIRNLYKFIASFFLGVFDVIGYICSVFKSKGPLFNAIMKIAIKYQSIAEDKKREELSYIFKDGEI